MNVFNRIAVSLILLGFIVSAVVVSLLPRPAMAWMSSILVSAQGSLDSTSQLFGAVVGLLAAVGASLLLIAELKPRVRHSVVVTQGATGTAELTNESIAVRVRRIVESVPSIRDVSPTIVSRGKSVDVLLRVSADPDVDLPQKSEEIMQAVRAEVESKIGIPVKSLKVTVRHSGNGRSPTAPNPASLPKSPFRR